MFNNIKRHFRWRKAFKRVDSYSYEFPLMALNQSLNDLLMISFDYMFMPEIEKMCFELLETISNINLMLDTRDEDEYQMAKHRVMYMLNNRFEEWYI